MRLREEKKKERRKKREKNAALFIPMSDRLVGMPGEARSMGDQRIPTVHCAASPHHHRHHHLTPVKSSKHPFMLSIHSVILKYSRCTVCACVLEYVCVCVCVCVVQRYSQQCVGTPACRFYAVCREED